ncbi:MAG: carbohydrate porin [Bdellovibrionales bacterium]|nr:carbohydrate porin [Ramlibacter sp.]
MKYLLRSGCIALSVLAAQSSQAVEEAPVASEASTVRLQSTYVMQSKRPFNAAYSGANSLSPLKEHSYSFTATAFLGVRAWAGTELYFNPEVAQGVAFSGLTGMGGFTNGELARTSGATLKLYRARAFARQTWGLGGGTEQLEPDFNQMAGPVDRNRIVVTAGNLSVTDIFDDNAYSHDPRTQFLNWALVTHGAYDFAADARGYTWGAAVEYIADGWALRAGRFLQPKEPNGQTLDTRLMKYFGDQVELERSHTLMGQPGKVRLLAFRNHAVMARFSDALALGQLTGTTPDLNAVRTGARDKKGFGINLEQAVSPHIGVFARAMWADGKTEAYAYTEIDRSVSAGALVQGAAWGRSKDTAGLAFARNGLSGVHRNYLAAGGLGFFVGDGKLNYRPETLVEAFYSLNLFKDTSATLDYQRISNPAYNADRGPVNVLSVRLHTEF